MAIRAAVCFACSRRAYFDSCFGESRAIRAIFSCSNCLMRAAGILASDPWSESHWAWSASASLLHASARRIELENKRKYVNSFRRKRAVQQANGHASAGNTINGASPSPQGMVGTAGRRRLFKLPKDKGTVPLTIVAGSALHAARGRTKQSKSINLRGPPSSSSSSPKNQKSSSSGSSKGSRKSGKASARSSTRGGGKHAAPSSSNRALSHSTVTVAKRAERKSKKQSGRFKRYTSEAPDWNLIDTNKQTNSKINGDQGGNVATAAAGQTGTDTADSSAVAATTAGARADAAAAEAAAELADLAISASMCSQMDES
eukprot:gene24513-28335_t